MLHSCPQCSREGCFLAHSSPRSPRRLVDYYRCDSGHIWTVLKESAFTCPACRQRGVPVSITAKVVSTIVTLRCTACTFRWDTFQDALSTLSPVQLNT